MVATFLTVQEVAPRCPDILDAVISDTTAVVGVGEGAHFVAEFNGLRAQLVQLLVERYGVSYLALEVGLDEAAPIEAWFRRRDERDLEELVGPLTSALDGSFLIELRNALGPASSQVSIVGVDLPNGSSRVSHRWRNSSDSWIRMRPISRRPSVNEVRWSPGPLRPPRPFRGGSREQWLEATRLAQTAVTTDLMGRAMAELFSGAGRPLVGSTEAAS